MAGYIITALVSLIIGANLGFFLSGLFAANHYDEDEN